MYDSGEPDCTANVYSAHAQDFSLARSNNDAVPIHAAVTKLDVRAVAPNAVSLHLVLLTVMVW